MGVRAVAGTAVTSWVGVGSSIITAYYNKPPDGTVCLINQLLAAIFTLQSDWNAVGFASEVSRAFGIPRVSSVPVSRRLDYKDAWQKANDIRVSSAVSLSGQLVNGGTS